MAFIPKLPTWHNTVTVYRATDGVWNLLGTITGQVYTPLRNQDDEDGGLIYFQYPKSTAIVLRDEFQGEADIVEIPMPGGLPVQIYYVRDVRPRWLGFPNEHLIADLQRVRTAAIVPPPPAWDPDIGAPPDPPFSPPPPVGIGSCLELVTTGFDTGECDDCGLLNGTRRLNLVSPSHWESAEFDFPCSPSARALWVADKVGESLYVTLAFKYPNTIVAAHVMSRLFSEFDPAGTLLQSGDWFIDGLCSFNSATVTLYGCCWEITFDGINCAGCIPLGSPESIVVTEEPEIVDSTHHTCGECPSKHFLFATEQPRTFFDAGLGKWVLDGLDGFPAEVHPDEWTVTRTDDCP